MKVITVLNSKGGVAKTTTVRNMSYILATRYDRKVLVIDMDPSGNLTSSFGLLPDELSIGIADAISPRRQPMSDTILHTDYPNIDLSPSTEDLRHSMHHLQSSSTGVFDLADAIAQLGEERYDYIIIDSSGAKDILTDAEMVASDELIATVNADVDSLKGVMDSLSNLARLRRMNSRVSIRTLLFTAVQSTSSQRQVMASAPEMIPLNISDAYIRRSAEVANARLNCQAVGEYRPRCYPAIDYENFVAEYLGKPPVYPEGAFRSRMG